MLLKFFYQLVKNTVVLIYALYRDFKGIRVWDLVSLDMRILRSILMCMGMFFQSGLRSYLLRDI